jgi:benzoylformate decarboxylase
MRMSGGKALMEIFRQEGVEYIFGLPGATEAQFMSALEDFPDIQFRLGLHEVVAAGMAEGYSRTSGKPAVLNLHTLTGLGAATPQLANAFSGGVPLIITAGQQDTRLFARDPALAGDLVKLASQFAKWSTEIIHAEDIPVVFQRAFRIATHSPAGPVFISLPQDVLKNEIDLSFQKRTPSYDRLHPQTEAIDLAARLLLKSRNPILIVEDGIAKSQALAEVVELAELVGARVYQPWMSDVNFPVDHPLYFGDLNEGSLTTPQILEKADLIVAVGVDLFSQVMYLDRPLLPAGIPLIQIDNDPSEIGKNFPIAVGVEGDIKLALGDINTAIKQKSDSRYRGAVKSRLEANKVEKDMADQALAQKLKRERNQLPITPGRLMQALKETLLPGTRIVDDCWSSSALLRQVLAFEEPLSYQRSRNGGSIGWGLPGAIGVKMASPDNPVVCVSGDGSALWSIQSLWTAARYQIPVTFVIMANGCYQMVRNARVMQLGEEARTKLLGTDLCGPRTDFCRIAEAMGIMAQRVQKPAELHKVLRNAFRLNLPNLVEVYVDGDPK